MENQLDKVYQGIPIEEEQELSLVMLCNYCRVHPDHIIEMVNEGILDPQGNSAVEWRFSFTTVERVRKAKRLQHDFELNMPGVAMVMHLIERIEQLESMLEVGRK